jgi:hypothetical protein
VAGRRARAQGGELGAFSLSAPGSAARLAPRPGRHAHRSRNLGNRYRSGVVPRALAEPHSSRLRQFP